MKNIMSLLLLYFSKVNDVLNASISVGQYFTQTTFSDSQGWGVIGGSAGFDTQQGKSIFGGGGTNGFGAGVTIYKQIILPPNHHTFKIKLRTWAINNWENEYILLKADGQVVNKQLVHSGLQTNFAQYLYQEIYFFHQNPSLLLEITSTLDEVSSNESWGVRDIEIIAFTCPGICEQCVYTDGETSCSTYTLQQTDFANLVVAGNEGWYVYNYPVVYRYCDQISLFGYYPSGITISKQFLITKTYFRALIKFQFWKMDAISTSIHYLYANGNLIWTFDPQNSKKISLCRTNSISEEYQNVQIEVIMNSQFVTLLFNSYYTPQPHEFYGIRDLYIYIDACIPDNIVCINDATTLADSQIIQDYNDIIQDLSGAFIGIPSEWKSYQQFSAFPRIASPKCSSAATVIQYMSLYDTLFKDFELGDHKTIKMIFYLYSQAATNTVKLQVDDTFSQDISIGYDDFALDCQAENTKFEQYMLYGIELPHTGSLARVQFNSINYPGGSFLQGFSKFEMYTGNCDCATCNSIAGDPCQTTYFLVDIDFSSDKLTQAEGWQLITYGISTSVCDGQTMLGGFNILNKNQQVRIQYTTPAHKAIRLQMMIYFLHQWISSDVQLVILVDNIEVWRQTVIYQFFASKTCGNSATSYQIVEIDQFLSHTNSDVVLKVYIDGGSGNEFWGVNNFSLSVSEEDII